MQTLLITGAAGFLGSCFVQQRARNHPQDRLILLDNFSHGSYPSHMMSLGAHGHIVSVTGDVRDGALVSDLIRSHDVTRIIHCATTDIAACQNLDSASIMDNNVSGTLMMLEAAKLVWSQKTLRDVHFHYVSCADGLPPNAHGLITDNENGAPESLYAASKLNAENLVLAFAHRYQIHASVSRPTTLYGPRQFPENIVAATIIAILEGRRLPMFGAGSQNVNMLHVEDAARGLNMALESTAPISRFGLAGTTVTTRDLIGLICRSVDQYAAQNSSFSTAFNRSPAASNLPSSTLIAMVQDRRQDTRARNYDFNRAKSQFGFAPREQLQNAITQTVHWYIENAPWWREIRDGQHQTRADRAMAG
jgi:dTDP-glucose 4,6-dehydratase